MLKFEDKLQFEHPRYQKNVHSVSIKYNRKYSFTIEIDLVVLK